MGSVFRKVIARRSPRPARTSPSPVGLSLGGCRASHECDIDHAAASSAAASTPTGHRRSLSAARMITTRASRTSTLVIVIICALSPLHARSQESSSRRRSAPPKVRDTSATPFVLDAAVARFVGVWQGNEAVKGGPPGSESSREYSLVIESAGERGFTAHQRLPDGAKGRFSKFVLADGVLTWESPNSGGGRWIHTAQLVARDSMAGSIILRDWPQWNGAPPSGTFALRRRGASPR
jgi:hypothetical protein